MPRLSLTHTTVLLRRATAARLRALAESIADRVESGKTHPVAVASESINPRACGVSMDALVNYLLGQLDAHRTAAAAQQARRKAGRKGP